MVEENYSMKERYNADSLVFANLFYVRKNPLTSETTDQKYILEKVKSSDGRPMYREIFTGIIMTGRLNKMYYDTPYAVNIESYSDYFSDEKGSQVECSNLLLKLNCVNSIREEQSKEEDRSKLVR